MLGVAILIWGFLNGVCRHEQALARIESYFVFLNGVCRHEQQARIPTHMPYFLNGVCRHEQFSYLKLDSI